MADRPLPADEAVELDLRTVLRVLGRRRRLLAVCALGALAVALASAFVQTKVYESSARVLFQRRISETLFDADGGQPTDPNRFQQTELEVLRSQAVEDRVRERIGMAPGVAGRPLAGTDVIEVTARHRDPKQAARIADAYADAYIEFRRAQAVDDLLAAAGQIQEKISQLARQMEGATGATLTALTEQQQVFRQKLDQVQVDAALKSGGAVKVAPATVPDEPVEPRPVRRAVVGAVFGLLGGIGLAFLFDHLDDAITSKADLEQSTSGLQVLGLIPQSEDWKASDEPYVASLRDPSSPVAEAYRTLRTSVQFLALDAPAQVIQVTSPNAGEGKTTTVANLAIAVARTGQPVVVVCCDLRRPRIHHFFGLPNEEGFISVLLGTASMGDALQPVPGQPEVQLLASGPEPPNPSELLANGRTAELFEVLKNKGYTVLVDSPPVLPVTDALVLSRWMDAVLVVTAAGATTRADAARALELLGRVNAKVVGTVLNGAAGEGDYDYGYSRGNGASGAGRRGWHRRFSFRRR